jgi:Sulfatase
MASPATSRRGRGRRFGLGHLSVPMRSLVVPPMAVALLALGGCGRGEVVEPRLVLLYATCTVNRDSIAPYGKDVDYTPNLAAFARGSVVFQRHQTETAQSGAAYASIFSGTQVDRHGVYRHPARLSEDLYLVSEAFADHGYEAHFWSGHPMASAGLGYGQGVRPENVHRRRPGVADLYSLTANDADFAAILRRLREDPSYRAYVQVDFTITHGPYTSVDPRAVADFRREHPEDWPPLSDEEIARWARFYAANYLRLQWDFPAVVREKRLRPADVARLAQVVDLHYRVGVMLLDHCFGRLVDTIRAAGLLGESLIAFTADHGETLYRENALFKWTHGLQLAPEAIQVPLIVHLPGRKARVGVYGPVTRSIDVYPTLAGLSGFTVARSRGLEGLDLSAAVRGLRPPPVLRAFSHTTLLGPELLEQYKGWLVSRCHPSGTPDDMWVAVRDRDLYARLRRRDGRDWGVDLVDLGRGPGATVPFDPSLPAHRDLAQALEAYKARLVAAYHALDRRGALPVEAAARERLRSLGYIQ